jgi:hypothetical protein
MALTIIGLALSIRTSSPISLPQASTELYPSKCLSRRQEGLLLLPDIKMKIPVRTARELNGWYSYAVAAEVFAVVGVGKLRQIILLSDINNDHLKIHKTHADIYTFKALFYP